MGLRPYAALAVPGNAELKTSGMALRKADWVFKGTAVDPREVQLLFVKRKQPYAFTHPSTVARSRPAVVPSYRFIWEVQGAVEAVSERSGHDGRAAGLRAPAGSCTTCATT